MAAIAPPPAPVRPRAPAKPAVSPPPDDELLESAPSRTIGQPPSNGHGGQDGGGDGHAGGQGGPDDLPQPPKKRRSIWPFLTDLGLVLMLFGLIIIGRFLIVIGAVIFVVALTGWIREARKDYSSLAD